MTIFHCNSQNEIDTTNTESDSLYFQQVQEQLNGCWKTKNYQFKYASNFGGEFKSRIHSSAPIFKLILKGEDVYLEWIELTGGEYLQKVISITKKKLTIENEEGLKFVYKRNKDCS
jgi:hypothetical protein